MEFARGYRHSLMNHLQVLTGWLQLGRVERAMSYVERLVGDLERERRLLERGGPRLAGLFLSRAARAGAGGAAVEYEVDEGFERACDRYPWLCDAAVALIDALGQPGGPPCAGLRVSLFARDGECGIEVSRAGVSGEALQAMAADAVAGRDGAPLAGLVRRARGRLGAREAAGGAVVRVALPWRAR